MGSDESLPCFPEPENGEDHPAKPEKTHEGQPPRDVVKVFPNDAGAKYSGINPVTLAPGAVSPHQIPPMSLSFYADEEVDETRGLPNPARELAEGQIAYLAQQTAPEDRGVGMETDPGPEAATSEGAEEDPSWSGALDLPKSVENDIILPHKGDKPLKEASLKEGKPRLALKPWRPREQ